MTSRAELLLFLGLPAQAGADEIELVYLERRAKAEKRLQQGDTRARFKIGRLDGVFGRLDGIDAKGEESGTAPVAVATTSAPSLLRPAGSIREANGSLLCGIASCLVVLWAFFVYWPSLTRSSLNVLNMLRAPCTSSSTCWRSAPRRSRT